MESLRAACVGAAVALAAVSLYQRLQESKTPAARRSNASCRSEEPETTSSVSTPARKPVRVYFDGCFDMFHYGHSNALRQARAAGDYLIVGIHTDEEITRNKGSKPMCPDEERLTALRSCKFVDEVLTNAPYSPTKEWVDYLVKEHQVDFILHGDDPCLTADGQDAFGYAKSIGVYKEIKRTEGISTTVLVGRMLATLGAGTSAPPSTFLPTSRRLTQFSSGKAPGKGDRVVYIAGAWDLFNVGHILALERARQYGDFLLVGIHDDETVNNLQGHGFPILNIHERALSVLSCKYVDEVIIGAPLTITEDMIKTMNIAVVVRGTVSNERGAILDRSYDVPRRLGIFQEFSSPSTLRISDIVERVAGEQPMYEAKFKTKSEKEAKYVANRVFLQEM